MGQCGVRFLLLVVTSLRTTSSADTQRGVGKHMHRAMGGQMQQGVHAIGQQRCRSAEAPMARESEGARSQPSSGTGEHVCVGQWGASVQCAGEQRSRGAGEQGSRGAGAQGRRGAGAQGRRGAGEQGSRGAGNQPGTGEHVHVCTRAGAGTHGSPGCRGANAGVRGGQGWSRRPCESFTCKPSRYLSGSTGAAARA